MQTGYYIPAATIHPDEMYTYCIYDSIYPTPIKRKTYVKNFQVNRASTSISNKSRKKITRAIKYMLWYSHSKTVYRTSNHSKFTFKVAFITLTLPSRQEHSDNTIKAVCLNQFLIEAKKKWNVKNYVWKAEKQKNGNIHFHILVDQFIPYQELRNTWNRIINKLGYVDRYRQKHHKLSPNSTDIHSLKKVKNVYSYIAKYMYKQSIERCKKVSAKEIGYIKKYTKGQQTVTTGAKLLLARLSGRGRLYGCSYELSNITGVKIELTEQLINEIEQLKKEKKVKVKEKEYITCLYWDYREIDLRKYPTINKLLEEYINKLFPSRHQYIDQPDYEYITV